MTNTFVSWQYEYSYRELGPNMNIHITWLTYVRTGPKKKKIAPRFRRSWSGGMLPQEIFLQIRCSEIASEAILRQAKS